MDRHRKAKFRGSHGTYLSTLGYLGSSCAQLQRGSFIGVGGAGTNGSTLIRGPAPPSPVITHFPSLYLSSGQQNSSIPDFTPVIQPRRLMLQFLQDKPLSNVRSPKNSSYSFVSGTTQSSMNSAPQVLSRIKLHGQRKRFVAEKLLGWYCVRPATQRTSKSITVVCISDTHNQRPEIPPGDILIHAGDLTENGSFDEMQAELRWLSSQPHKYKIFVAGNHDVLLDQDFLFKHPERRYGYSKTKNDLDWGSVIYLQDTSVNLNFAETQRVNGKEQQRSDARLRNVTVYGSPWTPQYGHSAFQYRPDDMDFWSERFSSLEPAPDIVVTHGPPKLHLDARDFHRAGCPYLSQEIALLKPTLHVFGHIHAGHGREDVILDAAQRAYEDIMIGWAGWESVIWIAMLVIGSKLWWLLRGGQSLLGRPTTFINAAMVGGPKNELLHMPITFELK